MNLHLAFFIPGLVAVLIVLCIAWLADRNGKKTQQMYDAAGRPPNTNTYRFSPELPPITGGVETDFDSQEEADRTKFRIQVERGQVVTVNGVPLHPDQVKSFNLDSIEIYIDGHKAQASQVLQGVIETEMPEPDLRAGVLTASGHVLDAWGELLGVTRGYLEPDDAYRQAVLEEIRKICDWENE